MSKDIEDLLDPEKSSMEAIQRLKELFILEAKKDDRVPVTYALSLLEMLRSSYLQRSRVLTEIAGIHEKQNEIDVKLRKQADNIKNK